MFNSTPARMARAARLAYLIESGDVDQAREFFRLDCGSMPWGGMDAPKIRRACAVWGVSALDFGCPPPRECPSDLWSVRASLMCDPVPMYPTGEDFQCASMTAAREAPEPAYAWRLEAIRWRMGHMGEALDLPAIEAATVAILALFARREAEFIGMDGDMAVHRGVAL